MAESSFGEPDACFVHVIPSDEVTILPGLPELPTATNCVPDQTTLLRNQLVPKGILLKSCAVHVIPSGDVRMTPLNKLWLIPTATNFVPDQTTPDRLCGVPEVRVVHVIPSGEVKMMPLFPTATNCVPDQATPNRF